MSDVRPSGFGPAISSGDWKARFGGDAPAAQGAAPEAVSAGELAATLAAKLCHDFISPASAIVSGLDLLEDPSAQDMREDAMKLIEGSAKKLVALLAYSRIAFGASASAETFDVRDLERLTRGVFDAMRAELDWAVDVAGLGKPAAKTLLNLAYIGGGALPTGGVARVTVQVQGAEALIGVEATGNRARLRPEVTSGLKGEALSEGLGGHWVQAYYLATLLKSVGGAVDFAAGEGRVVLRARAPAA